MKGMKKMISFIVGFFTGAISLIVISVMVTSGKESRREERDFTIIKCNENAILDQNTGDNGEK